MNAQRPARVREPIQVYLDQPDKALLEELAEHTGLPKAELLRRGIRKLAEGELTHRRPGAALDRLTGVLDAVKNVPRDLAACHDEYLYAPPRRGRSRSR